MPPVTARPLFATRMAVVLGLLVFAVFLVIAFVMTSANAGASFGIEDQVGTGVLGVLAGAAFYPFSHPRLYADGDGVRMRGFFGGWRTVPWSLIVAVEFPSSVRFARVVLPGEETLALYAVQRLDGERAVVAMQGLRALFAEYGPVQAGQQ